MVQNMAAILIGLSTCGLPLFSNAQKAAYNIQNGYVAKGYDLVEYFNHHAVPGDNRYTYAYDGADFRFSNVENLHKFKSDPVRYIPQYGGWCAYGMATNGKRYGIDPTAFEIRDGKLFLFYNNFIFNAQDRWLIDPKKSMEKADSLWRK